jgi:hypothetical protein
MPARPNDRVERRRRWQACNPLPEPGSPRPVGDAVAARAFFAGPVARGVSAKPP